MTATTASLSQANYILRIFQDGVFDEITQYNYLLTKMEKKSIQDKGRETRISLLIGENRALGVTAEGGLVPTPDSQEYTEFTVPRCYNNVSVGFTLQVLELGTSANTVGDFGEAMNKEMEGARKSLTQELCRQLYNGDTSGVMARVNAGSPSASALQLYAEQWYVNGSNGNGSFGTKFIKRRDVLAATSSRSVISEHGTYTVLGINEKNGTLKIDNVTSLVNGDYLVRKGNGGLEPVGMIGAIFQDDNIYMGFDRSDDAYSYWRPQVVFADSVGDGSGNDGILTDILLTNAYNILKVKIQTEPDLVLSEPGVWQTTQDYLSAFQRYDFMSTAEPIAGVTAVKAKLGTASYVIDSDFYFPRGACAMINTKTWRLYSIGKSFQWVDKGEGILKYDYSNGARNKYAAYGYSWVYPVCMQPRENLVIRNLKRTGF